MAKKIDYAAMFTLRKDGRYQAAYVDDTGRHYVYDRDPERLWHKLNDRSSAQAAPKAATFREVAAAWEREHREQITYRTWYNYSSHYTNIVDMFGDMTFGEIAAIDIVNDLKRAKAKGLSATVVNSRRSLYRMIFDYAVIHGHTPYNPISSIKLPRGLKRGKRTAPTDEQIKIICSSIDLPFGLFPFFLLCTGLRKSEALALQWSDIDLTAKTISVTKSLDYTNGANPKYKSPKTDAGVRTVPIIGALLPVLLDAKEASSSPYLFPAPPSTRGGHGGGLMTERGYEGAWLRYCIAAGLMEGGKPSITAHNLRHGTATLMFESDVDEKTAQRILGHSRVEITREIYTDLRSSQEAKSVTKFDEKMSQMMSTNRK